MQQKILTFDEFLGEHRRRVSVRMNKVLWACIAAGPFILVAVLLGLFKNVSIWAGPIVGLSMALIAYIHKQLLKKNVNVVITSIIAFIAIDCLLVFMDNIHLAIYLTWFLTPVLSLFFCDLKIYLTTIGINYVFMLTSVWLTAPYYVERRLDIETRLAYFLSRSGNFTAETIVMVAAGLFLYKLSMDNYRELFEAQEELYANQHALYEKQAQLSKNEQHIKEQMEVLESLSDIYDYAALIDPGTGAETEMRQEEETSAEERNIHEKYSLAKGSLLRSVAKEYEEAFRDFTDLSDIRERLADRYSISEEFVDADTGWFRLQFIAVGRRDDGLPEGILYTVQNIDSEKKERDKLAEDAATLNYRISSIANIFMTVHELDMASNEVTEIKSQSAVVNDVLAAVQCDPQGMLRSVMETVTDESSYDDVMRFIDLSTLEQRMRRTDTISIEYLNKQKMWRRGRFVASRRDEYGHLTRVLWLSEDIDNEKRERDELVIASERAIAASEAKSTFLSNISQEIMTPIDEVLSMNEHILRECEDTKILSYSKSVRSAAGSLVGIVNDILDFSGIEAGTLKIAAVDYDLSVLLNDTVEMIRTPAEEKGLQLTFDVNKNIPKYLNGDEIRIKQIIGNLMTNAVRYTEAGTVTLCVRSEKVPDAPDSVLLKVYVKDTGIGMKKEVLERFFSEVDGDGENGDRNIKGTRLGMSITKRLLEMMDSSLVVESIYGLGSKFSFELKQKVVDWEELGDLHLS